MPLHDHRYDLTALLAAITATYEARLHLPPNNPTGTMNTAAELDAYFDAVPATS